MNNTEAAHAAIDELRDRVLRMGNTGTMLAMVEVYKDRWRLIQYSSVGGRGGSRMTLMLANYVMDNLAAARNSGDEGRALTLSELIEGAPNIDGVRDIYVERGE